MHRLVLAGSLTVTSGLPAPTGAVLVATRPTGRWLSITVADHGTVPRTTLLRLDAEPLKGL